MLFNKLETQIEQHKFISERIDSATKTFHSRNLYEIIRELLYILFYLQYSTTDLASN